ncbi:hypothetical protein ACFTXM_32545 [Streptomyces sp. NPDC056930]
MPEATKTGEGEEQPTCSGACALGCGHDDFTRCPHYRTHVALGL